MEIAINGMKAVGYFKDEDKFLKRGTSTLRTTYN